MPMVDDVVNLIENNKIFIDDALKLIKHNKVTTLSGLYCFREITFETESGAISTRIVKSQTLHDKQIIQLFNLIANNTSLIELDLTGRMSQSQFYSPGEEICRTFRNAFQKNQTLKTLNLSKNYLNNGLLNNDLRHELVEILKVNRTLKTLILSKMGRCIFNNDSILELSDAFSSSNLEVLDISKNTLKDEGVRQIISAFAGNHSIKEITIHGNGISKTFLKEMPELIAKIPMLQNVALGKRTKLPWSKTGKKIKKITKQHSKELEFFEACNFLLMHWWRESRSPHSDSNLSILPAAIITVILKQLRDMYQQTIPNTILRNRVRRFAREQDKTLNKNLFPEDIIKEPKIRNLKSLQTGQRTGDYNYVLSANGQLFFGKKFKGPGGSHIDLADGKPVRCAGEVKFENGKLIEYDNASGHYLPGPEQTKKEMTFALQAIEKDRIKFVEKEWVKNKKHEDGGEWVPVVNRK